MRADFCSPQMRVRKSLQMIHLRVWWFMKKLSECQLYERRISIVNLGATGALHKRKTKVGTSKSDNWRQVIIKCSPQTVNFLVFYSFSVWFKG